MNSSSVQEFNHYRRRIYWLGYLGIIPALFTSVLIVSGLYVDIALQALRGYAVIILCFVGAIHWGRSMFQLRVSTVTASVIPASFAFVCLLLPVIYALPLLAIGFIALFLYDHHEYEDLDWFIKLRLPLSLLFIFCLLGIWVII